MDRDKIIFENYTNPKLAEIEVGYPKTASRGLVFLSNGKMLAFLKQKTGQYKLPGGGKEDEETPEETFTREVLEETGHEVKNLRKIGITLGYTQTSHIFVAEAGEYKGLNLDEDEIAADAAPIEITPQGFLENLKPFLAEHEHKDDEESMIKYAIALRDYSIVDYYLKNEQKRFEEWIGLKKKIHFSARIPRIREGEIWWCSLGENVGIEINGKSSRFTRPILIMKKLGRMGFMGIPLTSQRKTGTWYSHFTFLNKSQYAAICQARVISVSRLHSKIGQIPNSDLDLVKGAFHELYK